MVIIMKRLWCRNLNKHQHTYKEAMRINDIDTMPAWCLLFCVIVVRRWRAFQQKANRKWSMREAQTHFGSDWDDARGVPTYLEKFIFASTDRLSCSWDLHVSFFLTFATRHTLLSDCVPSQPTVRKKWSNILACLQPVEGELSQLPLSSAVTMLPACQSFHGGKVLSLRLLVIAVTARQMWSS